MQLVHLSVKQFTKPLLFLMFSNFLKQDKSLLILLYFSFRRNKIIILRLFRFEVIYIIAMNIFSISWESLRVILLFPWSKKYFIKYLHLVENLHYFHRVKNDREIVKNVFLSTKWSNIKWFSLLLYVPRYFISTKWKSI